MEYRYYDKNMQMKQWCDVPNQSDEFRSQLYVEQHWVFCADQNFEIAFRCCEQATKLAHNNDSAWYTKGFSLSELGRYEEAIASYDAALSIKPDFHEALNNKGVALGYLRRYEKAIAVFEQAISITPKSPSPWYNKACFAALSNQIE
ncbi:MAG: tetratricopeptide repeat protein [Cyanobacteria bacterium J06598_1]